MTKIEHEESRIQIEAVKRFRMFWPEYAACLFAIPNGGARGLLEAKRLKAEGVMAGVADLFLMVGGVSTHGLFIEMKTTIGNQSPAQKDFMDTAMFQCYADGADTDFAVQPLLFQDAGGYAGECGI